MLSDRNIKLNTLRNMEALMKPRAQHIIAPSLPTGAMTAHLFIDDAVLRLDLLSIRAAGGDISSRIRLDARKNIIAISASIQARDLQLPKRFPNEELSENSAGLDLAESLKFLFGKDKTTPIR